ncbi:DUF397 domain-containing protein [Streptomyces sp. NPDC059874]|uniref:DUF397 domain-containing protein n=1 Tax=Streptomyces sp. NPDC059874 TaxID=3346983 RepID=UPI003662B323
MTDDWQRSSYCAEGNSCVCVAPGGTRNHVLVAESADPGTRVLRVSVAAWAALLDGVKARRL